MGTKWMDPPDGGSVALDEQVSRALHSLDAAEAEIARLKEQLAGAVKAMEAARLPLQQAHTCLDGVRADDEEDEGEGGYSAACQSVMRVCTAAIKRIDTTLASIKETSDAD